jgi:hypothetical protein
LPDDNLNPAAPADATAGTPTPQSPDPGQGTPAHQTPPEQGLQPQGGEQRPDGEPAPDAAADAQPKPKSRYQRRVESLVEQTRSLQRQLDYYREQAERSGQPRRLDPLQFPSDAEYQRALIQETARQSQTEFARTQAQQAAQQTQMLAREVWSERTAEFKEQVPDFEQVLSSTPVYFTPHSAEMIWQMPEGPQVAYFLAKNPAEAQRIAQLTPLETAFELGRLATRIHAGNARRVSSAPPPVTTLRGGARAMPDLEKMSMDEFIAYRSKSH